MEPAEREQFVSVRTINILSPEPITEAKAMHTDWWAQASAIAAFLGRVWSPSSIK